MFLAIVTVGAPTAWAQNPAGVSISVPGVAMKNDIIKVKVSTEGGSEGIWPHTTGLTFHRGYHDHCGWCGKPCLVSDEIQACPTPPDGCCFNVYCLSCTWSPGHEFSSTWYGGPTWEFVASGCDTATIQAEYYGGSHEGPYLLPEHEIIILDGIEPSFWINPDDACVGEEIEFDASNTCGGTNFSWSFGDGSTGSGKITSHTYDEPGHYTVLLTVTSPSDSAQESGAVQISADCATIEGHVTDAVDGSPLSGAFVRAESVPHSRYTSSGSDGYYSMTVPPDITYTVDASKHGFYDSAPASASPDPDETITVDFALLPEVTDPIDPLAVLGNQWVNIGDPVHPATGNFTWSRSLFKMPGRRALGFNFAVAYNSLDHEADGPLGYGWTHAYNVTLDQNGDDFTLKLPDGGRRFFEYDAVNDVYEPYNCQATGVLTSRDPDPGWTYTLPGGMVYEFDGDGRIESMHDLHGYGATFTHTTHLDQVIDSSGRQIDFVYAGDRLASIVSPVKAGDTVSFGYDGAGNLTNITDPRGNSWSFTYDGAHRLITEHDRRGLLVLTNVYDGDGRITSQTDGAGNATTFDASVEGDRLEVLVTPPSGHAITNVYDENFRLLRSTDGEGHTALFSYSENGYPASATDKMGRTATFEFADNGLPMSVTDRLGATLELNHDANGFLSGMEDELGNVWGSPRYSTGELAWLINPDSGGGQFRINASGDTYRIDDFGGHVWRVAVNAQGLVSEVEDPNAKTTTYHHDDAGRVTQVDLPDALGSHVYAWDDGGNLISRTSPEGRTTTYTYDNENNVLTKTFEPTGATTSYTYDALSRPVTETNALGGVTAYAYDVDSNLLTITDSDGFVTTFEYNNRNEVTAVVSPSGARTSFEYDPNGRRVKSVDALGNEWQSSFDVEGRRIAHSDPLDFESTTIIDQNDRDITVVNALGESTLMRFNKLGELQTTLRADGTLVEQPRNSIGNPTEVTDGRGNTWQFGYDKNARITSRTDPDGATVTFGYDALGHRTEVGLRSGDEITSEYDTDGRILAMHLPDGTDVTFTYEFTPDGLTTTVTEALGVTTLTHDVLGRFTSKTDPYGQRISVSYTANGDLASITYPGDLVVTYSYDGHGRLETMTDWLGNVTTYTYDAADRLQRVDLPNQTATVYGYDELSRLVSLRHEGPGSAELVTYTMTRDGLGRIASMNVVGLPQVELADGVRKADYDAANRTTTSTRDLVTTTYDFDADGRQVARHAGAETTNYGYDSLGRLTSVEHDGLTTVYDIDWEGSRLRSVHDGAETRYLRRGNQIWTATDGGGGALHRYIWDAGGIVYSLEEDGSLRVLHTDPAGSVVAITGDAGTVQERYLYDPYGRVLGSDGTQTSELRYLGGRGVISDESALLQTGMRLYDPESRRFLSEDPLGHSASLNLYSYTGGDPVNRADASGLQDSTITWTAEVIAAVETWLQKGYEMGLRDPGELIPTNAPVKIGEIYVDDRLVTGHLSQNYSSEQALKVVDSLVEKEWKQGGPSIKQPLNTLKTNVKNKISNPTTKLNNPPPSAPPPPPPTNAVPPSQGNGFFKRFYNGVRSRGREILSGLATTYTSYKVLLSANASEVLALDASSAGSILVIEGVVVARVTSEYLPLHYNEVEGRWQTGDEVITAYFAPNQIAAFAPIEDPCIWFNKFLDSIGYSYDEGLKPAAPVK